MNLRKAVLLGLLAYAMSFAASIIILLVLGVEPSNLQDIPTSAYIIGMLASIAITIICCLWYFKKEKASAEDGFKVGIILVAVSFFVDLIFFGVNALTATGTKEILIQYYANIYFLLTIVLVIITSAIIGHFKKKAVSVAKKTKRKKRR